MFETILVPLDHSAFAEQAIAPAAVLARKLGADLDVVLVHTQPALANLRHSTWNEDQFREEGQYLQHIADRLDKHGVTQCGHTVLSGDVVEAICTHAQESHAGLIVMTSHGQTGFNRTELGSVAYGLVRSSSLPVLMLRDAEVAKPSQRSGSIFRKILVPLDGSIGSQAVLTSAAELARRTDAEIILFRVVEPIPLFAASFDCSAISLGSGAHPFLSGNIQDLEATARHCKNARAELDDVAAMLREAQVKRVDAVVVVGSSVVPAIVDYANAQGADLIAMATHGHGASRWILGSVADGVLRTSNFPVMLSRTQSKDAAAFHSRRVS